MNAAQIERAANTLADARHAVALTGAGVSTESGIPDFRSPSGLWSRFDPQSYATAEAFQRDPIRVWNMFAAVDALLLDATPNAGHFALARLEKAGGLKGIITQNIDGLHQRAGSREVIEYHGNHHTLVCPRCAHRVARRDIHTPPFPPRCRRPAGDALCGAILRPDVVLFGELIPDQALSRSATLLEETDVLLVIGTSCEVYPAASIPSVVQGRGGIVIEINLRPAQDLRPDILIQGPFSRVLPALLRAWTIARGTPSPSS